LGQVLKAVSAPKNPSNTLSLQSFYVEKRVDKFGDNRDKYPIEVEK
jgi:hypothetical protein